MRLGSEVQLGTSIATFSADGAGSFVLKESQQRENNACLACTGPRPHGWRSAPGILSWSTPIMAVSIPDPHSASRKMQPSSSPAEAGTKAEPAWVDSVLGSAHTVGRGANGIPLLHRSLELRGQELYFLIPNPCRLPVWATRWIC